MNEPSSLQTAPVQDIQLELIRRTMFNAMNGQQVYAGLLAHRDLWLAALLDRPGVPNYDQPGSLLTLGLIKLRDLPHNYWNADTLFVMTATVDKARALAKIIADEDWGGEVQVFDDRQEIDRALGTGRDEYGLLTVWWD
jgi:hypothetical protein